MVEACINPEMKELWPEPTSIFADLANAIRPSNDHA
jgi:hypothetical protein